MKFRLLDMAARATVHEDIMPRQRAPQIVSWGSRAFIIDRVEAGVAIYVEAETFRIGAFRE